MQLTLNDIRKQGEAYGRHTPEYFEKMMHAVPDAPSIDREAYIVEKCRGKAVLSLGHSGPLAKMVKDVATMCAGYDLEAGAGITQIDLDKNPSELREYKVFPDGSVHLGASMSYDLILCGEILEHLANPGNLLAVLKKCGDGKGNQAPVLITVPNAFCEVGRAHLKTGTENVNRDHVSYYSYWTLRRLVERYGFAVKEFFWYKGEPRLAEGLIMLVG